MLHIIYRMKLVILTWNQLGAVSMACGKPPHVFHVKHLHFTQKMTAPAQLLLHPDRIEVSLVSQNITSSFSLNMVRI